MTEFAHDLPEGMVEWVDATGGRRVSPRLERHVARREAWVVDVTRPDGSVLEGFLRLERQPVGLDSATSLLEGDQDHRGAGSDLGPGARGATAAATSCSCTLFERVRGRSDIDKLDRPSVSSGR